MSFNLTVYEIKPRLLPSWDFPASTMVMEILGSVYKICSIRDEKTLGISLGVSGDSLAGILLSYWLPASEGWLKPSVDERSSPSKGLLSSKPELFSMPFRPFSFARLSLVALGPRPRVLLLENGAISEVSPEDEERRRPDSEKDCYLQNQTLNLRINICKWTWIMSDY